LGDRGMDDGRADYANKPAHREIMGSSWRQEGPKTRAEACYGRAKLERDVGRCKTGLSLPAQFELDRNPQRKE
jgi:hypothetical protein